MRNGRYGDYEDDFDSRGDDRGLGRARDHERDHDRDVDRDVDRDADRDEDREGSGHGRERDDGEREGGLMTMTRRDSERDVRDIYNASLDDMRSFLREREGDQEDPMKSVTSNAVTGLEIVAGAAIAGFLAQRFRQAGAVVPVGITLAALGLAAAQFNKAGKFSPDLRNISFGALASAVALWAAGRGAISAEGVALGGQPMTAGMLPGMAPPALAPLAQMYMQQSQPMPMQQQMPMPMPMPIPMQRPQQQPQQQPPAMRAFVPPAFMAQPGVGRMDFANLVTPRER